MTIVEFIDIDNKEHLEAFQEVLTKGIWPTEFYNKYLEDLEFENIWVPTICTKIAKRYISEKLEGEK